MFWKVLREAVEHNMIRIDLLEPGIVNLPRMDPPIQTEYFLSGGATILTFMLEGLRAVSSFCMRSAMPGYMVVPPERTTLP